ncbi:hypothetical protein DAPPUDRAFT_303232 [Daphnia pulex]|uniref:Uncharacterized protein n=1 Tax=Daphnia pulex TaxID=6669 RepID=E9FTZ9_DAPPU|nr:hypothetical protein DAPPUDRAFT_303232 [Daphnia pulex]|eukprot:EFX89454.1 hypothetical protein DAPPUDRAFT_303232 [Daphnia pulex]
MDLFTVFVWIIFYLVVVTLFYYCFRQSMSSVQQSARARINSTSRTTPTTYSAASDNPRTNERRAAIRSGGNRSVFVITDDDGRRPSDVSDFIRSPPEYKWEDLPPSYEEAVGSFTNPTFNDHQQQQPSTSTVVGDDSTVIEVPASADSVN